MASNEIGSIFYSVDFRTKEVLNKVDVLDTQLDKIDDSFKQVDKSANNLNSGMTKLAKAVTAVIAATALRDMAKMVQSYQEMAERVQMATASQAEFETVQKRLLATANGTYRSLAEAQELYIRTADSLRSMGYSTSQAIDVTDSMSYSFVKNATSADRAQSAITAVSKAFNTGKVSADQYETITVALPSIIDDIATSSGKTAAEVRALGAAGKLTAQDLSEGLRKSLDENATAAEGMANNLTDAGVRSRNALTMILVALEKETGALQTFTNAIITAADMVTEFAGDGDKMAAMLTTLELAATSVAAVLAGRMVVSLTASAQGLYAATIAAGNKARADLAAAQTAAALAAQELIVARTAEQASRGLMGHAAAALRLAGAEATATAAARGLATAQTAVASTATIASTALAGLRTVMAFLGGPAGVVLLAAAAIYTFATRSKEAKPQVDLLTGSIDDLGDAALRLQKIQIADKLAELEGAGGAAMASGASVEYLRKQLEQFPNSAKAEEWTRRLLEQEAAAESAGTELDTYRKRMADIDAEMGKRSSGAPVTGGDTPNLIPLADPAAEKAADKAVEAANRAADAIKETVAALEMEADTLGMTETELALYKLQLAGASDAQIQAAATSRGLIDAYEMQTEAAERAAEAEAKRKEELQNKLMQADPEAAAKTNFEKQIADLKTLNEAKLIEDQRYLDLKAQAETAYAEQQRVMQEEAFRRQSTANALLIDSLNSLQSAGTNALTGLLTGASNGEEAIRSLAGSVLNHAVGALVEMGIQQVKSIIMGQTAAAAAAAAGVATAATLATAYAPAAAMASLASFGANAAPASAGITSTVALAQGLSIAGGRQYGGPVAADSMYRVNENGAPEVFNAANGRQYMLPNQRGEVVSNKDATASGGAAVEVYVNVQNNASSAGVNVQERDEDGRRVVDILINDLNTQGPASRAIERSFGIARQGR